MNNKPHFKTLDQKRQDRQPRFNDKDKNDNRPFKSRERDDRPFQKRERDDRPFQKRERDDRPFQKRERDDRPFQKRERDDRPFQKRERDDRRPRRDYAEEPKISYPATAKRSGLQEGTVTISVKGAPTVAKPEKKTGPLSPRAPEKIRQNRSEEMKVYGENSCLTLFQQRPEAIVRLWATVEMSHRIGALLSYLAEQKKAYHIVDSNELALITGTEHHGGICLLTKKAAPLSLEGYLQVPRSQDCLVLLDGVNNAQNIGGIIRNCAFYGVSGIVVESGEQLFSSSAARVAEGGLEFIKALETKHKQIALTQLREAGYQVVYLTRNKQAAHLAKTALNAKVVFVLSEIVPQEVENSQDTVVQLSFNNPLQSGLNVAVSSGILLGQWYQYYYL